MTPDQAAAMAADLLDDASKNLLDNAYVQSCGTVADAYMRLHLTLATGAAVNWDEAFPEQRG
ncbi:hypothetical protein [Nonomuraea sp. LPB2021202275-12-8]|uniref:hypothetical protein n=1 Tax=Nonomuraea sp. LPB2021202275-12-8 TaxID=3120159 RepID=UPI00300C51BA